MIFGFFSRTFKYQTFRDEEYVCNILFTFSPTTWIYILDPLLHEITKFHGKIGAIIYNSLNGKVNESQMFKRLKMNPGGAKETTPEGISKTTRSQPKST